MSRRTSRRLNRKLKRADKDASEVQNLTAPRLPPAVSPTAQHEATSKDTSAVTTSASNPASAKPPDFDGTSWKTAPKVEEERAHRGPVKTYFSDVERQEFLRLVKAGFTPRAACAELRVGYDRFKRSLENDPDFEQDVLSARMYMYSLVDSVALATAAGTAELARIENIQTSRQRMRSAAVEMHRHRLINQAAEQRLKIERERSDREQYIATKKLELEEKRMMLEYKLRRMEIRLKAKCADGDGVGVVAGLCLDRVSLPDAANLMRESAQLLEKAERLARGTLDDHSSV